MKDRVVDFFRRNDLKRNVLGMLPSSLGVAKRRSSAAASSGAVCRPSVASASASSVASRSPLPSVSKRLKATWMRASASASASASEDMACKCGWRCRFCGTKVAAKRRGSVFSRGNLNTEARA